MHFNPKSPAIIETSLDFKDAAEYADKMCPKITSQYEWEGSRLHFLTERIHPVISSPERPKVMLLFSNPHPHSIENGLFMSESHSGGFWTMLSNIMLSLTGHELGWDPSKVKEIVPILLNGNYGGPLLFFDCLYPISSTSPKDLKLLFNCNTDHFDKYLHQPSLERISSVIKEHKIKVMLVFTGETYESMVGKPGISRGSRQKLRSCIEDNLSEDDFWKSMDRDGLRDRVQLAGLDCECTAVRVMDTRAKYWRTTDGRSIFSQVLNYGLKYAMAVG